MLGAADGQALERGGGIVGSERLVLEPLGGVHAEVLFEGLSEPQLYRWISALPPPSVEWLKRRWSDAESRSRRAGGELDLQWAARRTSDGRYVGKLDVELRGQVAMNVGYIFLLPYWGQGFATEAVRAVAAHLELRGVVEQRAYVTLGNQASARVLAKAGFVRTRVLPDNDTIRGQKRADVEFIRKSVPAV